MSSIENNLSGRRISKTNEQQIYQLINSKLSPAPGDNAQARKEKDRMRRELEAFMQNRTTVLNNKGRSHGPKRLCYEDLPDLLKISGLSYLDLLKFVSRDPDGAYVEPKWATDTEAVMCSYCDILSPDRQEKVLEMVRRILAPGFQSDEFESMSPLVRLTKAHYLRNNYIGEMKRQIKDLGVNKIYIRRYQPYSYNAVDLSLISYFALNFDASPHWLLGLDESHTVLAGSGMTEKIMDLFCFLPEDRKQMLCQAVQTAIEKGGLA